VPAEEVVILREEELRAESSRMNGAQLFEIPTSEVNDQRFEPRLTSFSSSYCPIGAHTVRRPPMITSCS
jgi:hypothetical protein